MVDFVIEYSDELGPIARANWRTDVIAAGTLAQALRILRKDRPHAVIHSVRRRPGADQEEGAGGTP